MNAQDPQPNVLSDRQLLLTTGIDHAWQWFSLHATQRMQGVNFFLVASAFLTTAYVTALRYVANGVAGGVGVMGVVYSVCLLMFEIRVRELLKASEAALRPAQKALAEITGISSFEICDAVERPTVLWSSYHKIICTLYGCTAVFFIAATVYALRGIWTSHSPLLPVVCYRTVVALSGTTALYLGQRVLSSDNRPRAFLHWLVGLALIGTGCFVLIASILKRLN